MLPSAGSPVIDAAIGVPGSSPAADQRGITRPQGAAGDIGAVERNLADVDPDADGDGIGDVADLDDDNDQMSDDFERAHGFDPLNSADAGEDTDGDGLSNLDEFLAGTDPLNSDTDQDGLSDGDEVAAGTDPLNPGTDGDGVSDADEIAAGTDPLVDEVARARGQQSVITIINSILFND